MILGSTKETCSQTMNNTMAMAVLTLTQNSLDSALQQIRAETEKSINSLRQEMRAEVKNMEQNIAATVIAAIQATQPINMVVKQTEN
jgi:hypothetical protein